MEIKKNFARNIDSKTKKATFSAQSPLTREKRQQKQESRQPNQRDKSTKSV
jgi:hypothetical protein